MENYEQKYKESLERCKSWMKGEHPECFTEAQKAGEFIFPELKESEDEQHRKWILEYLYDGLRKSDEQFKGQFKAAIAWLEKQGEKSDYNPYKATVESITTMVEKYASGNLRDFYDNIKVKCKDAMEYDNTWIEKQGEQKSWSEEDEEMFDAIIADIQFTQKAHNHEVNQIVYEREIDWLKSLKPNNWKPSEQNIKDLEWCADLVKDKMGVGFHRLQVFIDEIKSL